MDNLIAGHCIVLPNTSHHEDCKREKYEEYYEQRFEGGPALGTMMVDAVEGASVDDQKRSEEAVTPALKGPPKKRFNARGSDGVKSLTFERGWGI